jgi:DNA-binding CsgD family transcriptional regulator
MVEDLHSERPENESVAGGLPDVGLTAREREVLHHLSRGLTYTAVAARMKVSKHTVDAHVRGIKRKFGIASWVELLDRLTPCPGATRGHAG